MPVNISEHLKKKYWKRRVTADMGIPLPHNSQYYEHPTIEIGKNFRYLTQEDFMREIEPSAHSINEKYQSTRPVRELQERDVEYVDENGNLVKKKVREWKIVGYDDLETTRYGLQMRMSLTKSAHFAGDGWSINNEQLDKSEAAHKRFDNLNSWRDVAGLDNAFMEISLSCFQTGDAGIYLYTTPTGTLEYKVYSYLDGYQIFPDVDENRDNIYYILYSIKGKPAVDVFASNRIETWVQADLSGENADENWVRRVRNWFRKPTYEVSEDGWKCVSRKPTQIGDGQNQFVYFYVRDIPSGPMQEDIENLERTSSFVAEGVKQGTFNTLFVKATKIKNLPMVGGHGSVIGVEGDVESIKAADAKSIQPGDISNVAELAIKEKKDSILHSSLSVIIDPDVLRSGADSSSAMRLCFNDEVKWCMTMQTQFFKPLKELVEILKALVAKIEGDGEYTKIRTSITMNTWVPSNFSEQVENVCKLKYASILSAENARHELDVNYPDDMSIVRKEAEDDLYQKTYVPLKAKYEAEQQFGVSAEGQQTEPATDDEPKQPEQDTGKPGVTNQATRK